MKNPLLFLGNHSLRTLAAIAVATTAFTSLPAQPAAVATPTGEKMPFQDASLPIEARVKDLVGRLTLEEKVYMTHGHDNWESGGIPRLGLPEYVMDDGPLGVRDDAATLSFGQDGLDYTSAMPAAIGLAATWNPKMAFAYGDVIGAEAFRRGKFEMLGPSLNIQRTPLNGRNFEYMGEDPFLTSQIAVGYIHGEQSEGVSSTAKHFAGNNQETARNTVDAEIDLRTLHEIYLPAFKAAVQQGGVLAVMGSYNFLNGVHACENDWLLNKTLKDTWGFKGLVVSDWGGVHDTKEAALNGMDIEMAGRGPDGAQNFLGDAYLQGLKDGTYPLSGLDDKVSRIAYVMIKLGLLDVPNKRNPIPITADNMASTKEHQASAREIEAQAIVLLKNQGNILPLDASKIKTIAVIGDYADRGLSRGGGSATIKSPYEITALDAIKYVAGPGVTVNFAQGFTAQGGRGGGGGGGRGGNLAGANPVPANPDLVAAAVAAAKAADVVIYVGGLSHDGSFDSEGTDRANLNMPWGQNELLDQVLAANPKTVVVLYGGGALEMPWVDKAPGLLYAWYPGIEGANALAQIIFGYVDPSGKLPCTFPKQLSDTPTAAGGVDAYPGIRNPNLPPPPAPDPAAVAAGGAGARRGGGGGRGGNALIPTTVEHYTEKLLVGYRWYDTKNIEPLFPFGFGLSYTKFDYKNLKLVPGDGKPGSPIVTATFDITNTGAREGMEVAELYIHQVKSTLDRPEKELKGFSKIDLKPGETQTVSIPLDHSSFAYFDPDKDGWVAEAGDFNVIIGASSRDPRLNGTYSLAATSVVKD